MKALKEALPKYKYLLETVSNCIRAFRNHESDSPYLLNDTGFETIIPYERDLFIPEAKFLMRVFQHAKKNRAIVAVSKAYVHFAWNDADAFKELLEIIGNYINELDYDTVKPVLILTQFMLEHPGQDNEARFELILSTFLGNIKKNNQVFYKFMEVVIDFIFKIISRNTRVRDWFYNNKA